MSLVEYANAHGGKIFNALLLALFCALASEGCTVRDTVNSVRDDVKELKEGSGDRYPGSTARDDLIRQYQFNLQIAERVAHLQGLNEGRRECQ